MLRGAVKDSECLVRARDTTARGSAHLGLVVRKFALVGVGRLAEAVDLQRLRVLVAVDRHEAGTQRRFGRPHRAHELVPLPLANHADRELHVVRVGPGHVDEAVGVVHHEQRSGARLGGTIRLGTERAHASLRDDDATRGVCERHARVERFREHDVVRARRWRQAEVAAQVLDRRRPSIDVHPTPRGGLAQRRLRGRVALGRKVALLELQIRHHLGQQQHLVARLRRRAGIASREARGCQTERSGCVLRRAADCLLT